MSSGGVGTEGVVALGSGTVLLHRGDGFLEITIARPEKRNALTAEMIDSLHEALDIAEKDSSRVVVLKGAPGFFCAGADIGGYVDAHKKARELVDFTVSARELCRRFTTSESIVIAVVDGIAMGGGFELVLAADLVVASESSTFGLPEVKLGLIPGWGGTQRLGAFFGPNRTKHAIFTGIPFTAQEAAAAGLITTLVSSSELDAAAADLVALVCAQAPRAVRGAKQAIATAFDPTRGNTPGAELETLTLLELFASSDGREGVAAFAAKRPAQFTGA
jgi:enoyl-CoA hydratase/carnithine racemase